LFRANADLIRRLTRTRATVGATPAASAAAHQILVDGSEVIVPLAGIVDLTKECTKLKTELEQLETQLHSLSQRLRNQGFLSRAPESVVEAERRKEQDWINRRDQLADKVAALCGG
jgi:valyl-tRNA synthetase